MNINLMIVSEYLINAGKRIIVKLNKYTNDENEDCNRETINEKKKKEKKKLKMEDL